MCFPGMERPAESWHPVAATLARVKRYFEGYQANDRQIFAKRQYIADRLGMHVRTLARYIQFLRDTRWMETVRRKAHTAIRKVLNVFRAVLSPVPSLASHPLSEENTSETSAALPDRIEGILERAAKRIRRAKNPAAYRQAIISCELRLMKSVSAPPIERKPVQPAVEYYADPVADKKAIERFFAWA